MERIAPLAKILAEANGIEWEQLKGTGAGGMIVEQDILDYLSRVMSGEAEPPSTPVDAPPPDWTGEDLPGGGMFDANMLSQAGVESDIADFVSQSRPTSPAAPAPQVAANDDFELDDAPDEPLLAPPAPAQTPSPFNIPPVAPAAPITEPAPPAPAGAPVTPPPASAPATPPAPPAPAGGGLGSLLSRLYHKEAEPAKPVSPVVPPAPSPSASPFNVPPVTPVREVQDEVRPSPAASTFEPTPRPDFTAQTPAMPVTPEPVITPTMPEPALPEPVMPEPVMPEPVVTPPSLTEPAAPEPITSQPVTSQPDFTAPAPSPVPAWSVPEREPVQPEPQPEPVISTSVESVPAVSEPQQTAPVTLPVEEEVRSVTPPAPVPLAEQPGAFNGVAPAVSRDAAPRDAVWFGTYLRRDANVAQLHDLRSQLSEALEREVPLALLVARAAQRHAVALGLDTVAMRDMERGMTRQMGGQVGSSVSLRDALVATDDAFDGTPDLLVVDAGALDMDDLHYPDTLTLSVGRVQDGRAALSLQGDVDPEKAARFLASVAQTLEKPVILLV